MLKVLVNESATVNAFYSPSRVKEVHDLCVGRRHKRRGIAEARVDNLEWLKTSINPLRRYYFDSNSSNPLIFNTS